MGLLRSYFDCSGSVVDGVFLVDPDFTDEWDNDFPLMFVWHHVKLPQGVIEVDGTITLDEVEEL